MEIESFKKWFKFEEKILCFLRARNIKLTDTATLMASLTFIVIMNASFFVVAKKRDIIITRLNILATLSHLTAEANKVVF